MGPPSLWPVEMLFNLACWYRGLHAGRLQLGIQSFSIYRRPPHTHTHPFTHRDTHTFPDDHTHYPLQHQFRDIAIPGHPPPPPVPFRLSYLPLLNGRENLSQKHHIKKKQRYCGCGRIQGREADSVVLLLRPLTVVMTRESRKY